MLPAEQDAKPKAVLHWRAKARVTMAYRHLQLSPSATNSEVKRVFLYRWHEEMDRLRSRGRNAQGRLRGHLNAYRVIMAERTARPLPDPDVPPGSWSLRRRPDQVPISAGAIGAVWEVPWPVQVSVRLT